MAGQVGPGLCAQLSAASWSPGENPVLFLSRDTLGLEGGIFWGVVGRVHGVP